MPSESTNGCYICGGSHFTVTSHGIPLCSGCESLLKKPPSETIAMITAAEMPDEPPAAPEEPSISAGQYWVTVREWKAPHPLASGGLVHFVPGDFLEVRAADFVRSAITVVWTDILGKAGCLPFIIHPDELRAHFHLWSVTKEKEDGVREHHHHLNDRSRMKR